MQKYMCMHTQAKLSPIFSIQKKRFVWLNVLIYKLNGFLVSKETVVLHWWESETKNIVLSKALITVELPQKYLEI